MLIDWIQSGLEHLIFFTRNRAMYSQKPSLLYSGHSVSGKYNTNGSFMHVLFFTSHISPFLSLKAYNINAFLKLC